MPNQLIKYIKVVGLFGLYNYDLKFEDLYDNTVILYGDNGVGKSTILKLAFHLLSPAGDKGHRTALRKIDFKYFEVQLSSGIKLSASKDLKKNSRLLNLKIYEHGETIAIWEYYPSDNKKTVAIDDDMEFFVKHLYEMEDLKKNGKRKLIKGEAIYLRNLARVVPKAFILDADRRLDSDSVSDANDEVDFRRQMHYSEPKRISDLVARSREIALTQALGAATKWIATKAVQSTNQGSDNVHSVYNKVLRHLISSQKHDKTNISQDELTLLIKKLDDIDYFSSEYAKFEFSTSLDIMEFKEALMVESNINSSITVELIKPYIESLESRLDALKSIYKIVNTFTEIINELLSDKLIYFKLSRGFSIQNKFNMSLLPSQLSSGEQQLLLLFCYVLVARDSSSVFIIDEPEISLNIKWQRKLVDSLIHITDGANIQFIFASHSMEIISQHRDKVVVLENTHE